MWLHDVFRAYFDTADLTALTDAQREAGIEALLADFAQERSESGKLVLWTIMFAAGGAPCPATTHLNKRSRRVARTLMRRTKTPAAGCHMRLIGIGQPRSTRCC